MEMIRRDEYAVYKGQNIVYPKIGNRFILTSTNQKDLQNGFTSLRTKSQFIYKRS